VQKLQIIATLTMGVVKIKKIIEECFKKSFEYNMKHKLKKKVF